MFSLFLDLNLTFNSGSMKTFTLVVLSFLSISQIEAQVQNKLSHRYNNRARQHSSFYGTVAFEQHRYTEMLELGNGEIVLIGCNRALTHILVQQLGGPPNIDSIELPQAVKVFYGHTSLTLGNAQKLGNTIVLLLNGRFIIHLKRTDRDYRIEKYLNIEPIVHNIARKFWFGNEKYYLVVEEPTEIENPECDLYRTNLIQLNPKDSSFNTIWRKEFLKRYTRNTYFNNYFFRDSSFIYFNPLNYEVHKFLLLDKNKETIHHFAGTFFQKSNEHMLFLAEQNNHESNIKQFINITREEYTKDRIVLIYSCKEGYLVWKTNYPKKDSFSLDFVSTDFTEIRRNVHHSFYHSRSDTTEIGSFNSFPFFPRANNMSFFDGIMIVAINHSGVNFTTSTTHAEIWKEFYKTIGRSFQGQYIMDYYFFNYTLE